MAYGLKVWDSSGTNIIDTSTSVARLIGSATVTAGSSGNVTNSELSTGTPFYIWQPSGAYSGGTSSPTFSFSGTTLSWTSPTSVSGTVFYGVKA